MEMKPIEEPAAPLLKTNPGFAFSEGTCPVREVLTRIGDKWSLYVIFTLQSKPMRFNELKRNVEGISQRMLTVTLRALERDGFVSRTVHDTTPPSVEYRLTEFGQSLAGPIAALGNWAAENRDRLRGSQALFDDQESQR